MNKKNVIFILIDGLNYSFTNMEFDGKLVCPFIKKLSSEHMAFNNMYSQGTYTMSSVNSIFTGDDIIHDNIYDSFFSSHKKYVFDEFINNGYETFLYMLGFGLPKSDYLDKIDHLFYYCEEDALRYFKYFYDYYSNIIETSELSNVDMNRIAYFTDSLFDGMDSVLNPLAKTIHLFRNAYYPWEDYSHTFFEERQRYKSNKQDYIYNLLQTPNKCKLFDEKYKLTVGYLPESILENGVGIYDKYSKILKKKRFKQRVNNTLHNGIPLYAAVDYYFQCRLLGKPSSESKEKLINYRQRVADNFFTPNSLSIDCKENKSGMVTADAMFSHFVSEKKSDRNKPFFACFHLEDTHQPFNYFSIDQKDKFEEDIERSIDLVDKIKISDEYHGSFPYLLSASYVDRCLERFVDDLRKRGLLDNTIMVITSDHGSVYGNSPIRGSGQANNVNEEGYHIPCIIADFSSKKQLESFDFFETSDIFPTIFNLVGIQNTMYKGVDMLSGMKRMSSHGEHFGSGVADVYRKPILYTIRDDKYLVVCKTMINSTPNKDNVLMVYDRKIDQLELKNRRDSLLNLPRIAELIEALNARHREIQNEYL